MPRNPRDRKTLIGAFLASLALHALGTPFFAPSSTLPQTGAFGADGQSGNERVRSTMVGRIAIESPRAIHATRPPARIAKPREHRPLTSTPVAPRRARSALGDAVATSDARSQPTAVPRAGNGRAMRRARGAIAITIATAAPDGPAHISRPSARERAEIDASATPAPTPTPLATAESTPVAIPSAAATARVVAIRAETGIPAGGWGASFEKPLVADESALEDLRARYRGARTIRVDVDEAGHATRVVIPASMPTDLRAALEHDLLALRYVPAECNGLRCGGTLQLIL